MVVSYAGQIRRLLTKPQVLMIGITLVAAFLRFYRLNDFPPALYLDEAWDAFDALRIVRTRSLYLFFGGSYGREPLMITLQAVAFSLWGSTSWALRLVPAAVGVATVPALYRAVAEIFDGYPQAKWFGALAAAMLAVSFWHVDISRLSPRVIFVPFFSVTATAAFWRGWTRRSLFSFAWAGVLMGVGLYTYGAARFIPLTLILFAGAAWAMDLLAHRSRVIDLRPAFLGIGIMLLLMLVVFAPLSVYYLNHPGAFFVRASDVSVFECCPGNIAQAVADNAFSVIHMFSDFGDMEARHNIPGRPALDVLATLGFWLGLAIALRRVRAHPAFLLLLIWLGLNLLPTLFTTQTPHFLRSINALPAMMVLAAVGFVPVWRLAISRTWWPLPVAAVILFSGGLTFHDYFDTWGPSHVVYYEFDGLLGDTVDRAMTLSQVENVMVPLSVYGSPQMQFALAKRYPQSIPVALSSAIAQVSVVAGEAERSNIVVGPQGIFVPQPLNDAQITHLRALLRDAPKIKNRFGEDVASELSLQNASDFLSPIEPAHLLDANFGDLRLLGYSVEPTTISPGSYLRVTYYWQANLDLNSDYVVATTLLDAHGDSFGQRVAEPISDMAGTSLWRRGAVVPEVFQMQASPDAHEGKYRLEVGLLYGKAHEVVHPLQGSQDRLVLDPITVGPAPANSSAAAPLQQFGDPPVLSLLGYDLASHLTAGQTLELTLRWQAAQTPSVDYSIFLHLVDSQGNIVAQQDGPPQDGNAPTSWWRAGDSVVDRHRLNVSSALSPGHYELQVGAYDSATGARLPLHDSDGRRILDDALSLPVEIVAP